MCRNVLIGRSKDVSKSEAGSQFTVNQLIVNRYSDFQELDAAFVIYSPMIFSLFVAKLIRIIHFLFVGSKVEPH